MPLLIGGMTDHAVQRVVRFGIGWTVDGAPPDMAASMAEKVRAAWRDAGWDGQPRLVALGYFSLGDTEARSREYLLDYYRPMGEMAQTIADSALRSPEAIAGTVERYRDMGFDEFIFDPTVPDPDR